VFLFLLFLLKIDSSLLDMLNTKLQIGWLLAVVLLLALFRLLPHPPNVTPIATMALFAGAYFPNRLMAYLFPLAVMLLSDVFIGFHATMLYVYTGMLATVFLGGALAKLTSVRLGVTILLASVVFYALTNFGAWLHHDIYPRTLSGLQQAYVAGLPFFRNALITNFILGYAVFYSFNRATKYFATPSSVQAS